MSSINSTTPDHITRTVHDTMPLVYIIWDTKGNGLYCGSDAARLFGLRTAQEVFDNWNKLSPSVQPNGYCSETCFKELLALAQSEGKTVFTWMSQTINGESIPVEITCIKGLCNHEIVLVTYIKDLRGLKKSMEVLDDTQQRFASILHSCPICLGLLSGELFTFTTPTMENFLGVKVGDSLNSFITDKHLVELLCGVNNSNDVVSWIPVTIRTHHGDVKEMLAYSLPFGEEIQDYPEKILWLIDVTQNRKLESDLKIAKELAENNTKAKSLFLANMSHEIRTPMNAIIGLSHLALRTSLTDQQKNYIETISQSAHILLKIINDILDFSKIEAGRMVLEYREFSIGSIISELSAVVSLPIQKKQLELQIEMSEELPHTVMGDSVRLHQVILNLMTNAVKFTEKGTILLNAEVVEIDVLSVVLRFSVSDTGIGMTPLQVESLFKPFSQATASITRQFGGTGLGLAISKQIVELMGGTISCQSSSGTGTTFSFTARFGMPLETDRSIIGVNETRTDALLVGENSPSLDSIQHYIELLGSKSYRCEPTLTAFNEIIENDSINNIDFIIVDCSDVQKDFIPFYNAIQEKHEGPLILCVLSDIPNIKSLLTELGIVGSVWILHKESVTAGDLMNVMANVVSRKEEVKHKSINHTEDSAVQSKSCVIPRTLQGAKILLAEDNTINRMVAVELLKTEGFVVMEAENGKIAVDLLQKHHFDLVLMDMQMPEMDGIEATKTIRSMKQFNHIPILAMTANAMESDRKVCLEAGMDDHIGKPIEPYAFYQTLVKWLKK